MKHPPVITTHKHYRAGTIATPLRGRKRDEPRMFTAKAPSRTGGNCLSGNHGQCYVMACDCSCHVRYTK